MHTFYCSETYWISGRLFCNLTQNCMTEKLGLNLIFIFLKISQIISQQIYFRVLTKETFGLIYVSTLRRADNFSPLSITFFLNFGVSACSIFYFWWIRYFWKKRIVLWEINSSISLKEKNKIGHSSRSSSIQRSRTAADQRKKRKKE